MAYNKKDNNKQGVVMKITFAAKLAWTLLIIGGLNWGVIGFFNYNVVGKVFSNDVARIIYAAVGIAALCVFYSMRNMMPTPAKRKK
jgi:uncharacterized membrane protein YuzA (DUF378 family)